MNKHREIIYKRRQKILQKLAETEGGETVSSESWALHEDLLASIAREGRSIVQNHTQPEDPDEWNWKEMAETVAALHPEFRRSLSEDALKKVRDRDELSDLVTKTLQSFYEEKCKAQQPAAVLQAERVITLRSVDTHWMSHIDEMSHLREQVAFSGFAQRDPVIEYQDQAFRKFQQLLSTIEATIVRTLLQIDFAQFTPRAILEQAEEEMENLQTNEAEIEGELTQTGADRKGLPDGGALLQMPSRQGVHPGQMGRHGQSGRPTQQPITASEVGRNDPCPCGSGKKFKKCHGKDS
jgi:preprotein translocase subunit SecA